MLGTVLITGAAIRIGASMARYLSKKGYKIALHYNNSKAEAVKMQKAIIDNGGHCKLYQADLVNEEAVNSIFSKVIVENPDLTLLINSASIFENDNINNYDLKLSKEMFNINLLAPIKLSSLFFKHSKKGEIINVLDSSISKDSNSNLSYILSKKALFEFTKYAAVHMSPNFRVNSIAPGHILEANSKTIKSPKKVIGKLTLNKPELKNILIALNYLIENRCVTGEILHIDSGNHLNF